MVVPNTAFGQKTKPTKSDSAEGGLKNANVYATRLKPITYDELTTWAKECEAELELLDGEQENWKSVKLSWEGKSMQIFHRDNEGLDEHLQGFSGYTYNRLANEKMDALVFGTIRQIRLSKNVYGMLGEPALHDSSMEFVSKMAQHANGLVFLDESIWSPELKIILGTNGRRDEEAKLPKFESALDRRDKTNERLKKAGVPTSEYLPVIVADEEVSLRDAKQVARRALCLFAVAKYAAGDKDFKPIDFLKKHDAWSEISGQEKAFLESKTPDKATANTLTWRYESCQALLWCLDQRTIDFPNELVSVQAISEVIFENAEKMVEKAKLRPTAEILDHNDLVYRCLWAGREARQNKQSDPSNLNLSVVYERVYALNWITQLLNADWDFVPTDS